MTRKNRQRRWTFRVRDRRRCGRPVVNARRRCHRREILSRALEKPGALLC